jgi:hypothetical protein
MAPRISNVTFDRYWVADHGVCQPANHYEFGVSVDIVFTFAVFTTVVTFILAILQLAIHRRSRWARLDHSSNAYRDALDLAEELKAHFGDSVEYMSAANIASSVSQDRGDISIDTEGLPLSRHAERLKRKRTKKSGPRSKATYSAISRV